MKKYHTESVYIKERKWYWFWWVCITKYNWTINFLINFKTPNWDIVWEIKTLNWIKKIYKNSNGVSATLEKGSLYINIFKEISLDDKRKIKVNFVEVIPDKKEDIDLWPEEYF